jgi:hypothetical protein
MTAVLASFLGDAFHFFMIDIAAGHAMLFDSSSGGFDSSIKDS